MIRGKACNYLHESEKIYLGIYPSESTEASEYILMFYERAQMKEKRETTSNTCKWNEWNRQSKRNIDELNIKKA